MVNDMMVVVMWVMLLWGQGSVGLLLLVSLLLLLHEVELVVPLAVQTFLLSLLTFAFPLPLTLFTVVRPGFLSFSFSFAPGFLGGRDPFTFFDRNDPRSRHPSVGRFQNPIGIDVNGRY